MENFEAQKRAAQERMRPEKEQFLDAVGRELEEMRRSDRITQAQSDAILESAKSVDAGLSDFDALLHAWSAVATPAELEELTKIHERTKAELRS